MTESVAYGVAWGMVVVGVTITVGGVLWLLDRWIRAIVRDEIKK